MMICKEIIFSDHAISQMFKRNIAVDDVKHIIVTGETILTYIFDKPYPSSLLFGFVVNRPLHIVIAKDDTVERCIVVTAYEPDKTIWHEGFKTKRK